MCLAMGKDRTLLRFAYTLKCLPSLLGQKSARMSPINIISLFILLHVAYIFQQYPPSIVTMYKLWYINDLLEADVPPPDIQKRGGRHPNTLLPFSHI
jgi:hypothetical protein